MHDEVKSTNEMAVLLDRLVCGELDEAARRPLMVWLDEDPRRWRMCGLAFLEAQTWSQAMDRWSRPTVTGELQVKTVVAPHTTTHNRRSNWARAAYVATWVAGMVVAYVVGTSQQPFVAEHASSSNREIVQADSPTNSVRETDDGNPQRQQVNKPVLAELTVNPGNALAPASTVHIPVVPVNAPMVSAKERSGEIPDYVRQQFERRGLKLTSERRYLFAKLPDGKQVIVPVEQYQLRKLQPKVY